MHSARFRDRVAVQSRVKTITAIGKSETWSTDETRWANVTPLTASQRVRYQQVDSEATHRVVFRAPLTMTFADTRFLWGDVVLEPLGGAMDPQARHHLAEVMVRVASPEEAATS